MFAIINRIDKRILLTDETIVIERKTCQYTHTGNEINIICFSFVRFFFDVYIYDQTLILDG